MQQPMDERRGATSPTRYQILDGGATDSGVKFEMKMAALLLLRAQRRQSTFSIYRNVAAVRPFDDLVLEISAGGVRCLVLVQLKHGESESACVRLEAFSPRTGSRGDFNLRKYFKIFQRFYEIHTNEGDPPTDDERNLSKTPMDEIFFIIYTNKAVKMTLNAPPSCVHEMRVKRNPLHDSLLQELFSTNPLNTRFSFNQSHPQVWHMYEDESEEKLFQEEFLPRLIVFHCQSHVNTLDDIIMKELEETYGNVAIDAMEIILHNFYNELEPWVKGKPPWLKLVEQKGQQVAMGLPITHCDRLLERAVGTELRRRGREAAKDLRFKEEHCQQLRIALRTQTRLRLAVGGVACGHRAAKIIQILEGDDYKWCYINDQILGLFSDSIMKATMKASDIILLDVTSCQQLHMRVLIREVNDSQIIIELCDRDENGILHLPQTLRDQWSLDQLTEASQDKLLNSEVNFQGNVVALRALEAAWRTLPRDVGAAAISSLAAGHALALGAPLAAPPPHYLARAVQHRSQLRRSVLQLRSRDDCFVLSGFPASTLSELRAPMSTWQECQPTWEPMLVDHSVRRETFSNIEFERSNERSRKTLWTVIRTEERIEAHPSRNTHWLSCHAGLGDRIVWDKTIGESNILVQHIQEKNPNCTRSFECIHDSETDLVDWRDKSVILSDVAGMGKTTFLKKMATTLKEYLKTHWVIFVEINNSDILQKLSSNICLEHVYEVLFHAAELREEDMFSSSARAFLRHCAEMSGNVAVLVDGVDEVCPKHKTNALQFLKLLRGALERSGGKLWAAARRVLEEDLKQALRHYTVLTLRPFDEVQQMRYLLTRWENDFQGIEPQEQQRRVAALVHAVRDATNARGRSLCDVPLYMDMIAEIYNSPFTEIFRESFTTSRIEIDRLRLFSDFIKNTLYIRWTRNGYTIDDTLEKRATELKRVYTLLAIKECFGDEKVPGNIRREIEEAEKSLFKGPASNGYEDSYDEELISKHGIVTTQGRNITFTHYSIAEFLAAHYLFEHRSSLKDFIEKLYTKQHGESLRFFDEFMTKDLPFLKAALIDDREVIEAALASDGARDQTCEGGRHALHYAVIGDHVKAVAQLLTAGVDASPKDKILRWTPLRYADAQMRPKMKDGAVEHISHLEIINQLLAQPGGKSRDIPRTLTGRVFIEYAVKQDYGNVVRKVIKKHFSLFSTPLIESYEIVYLAARHESALVLRLLREARFRINRIDKRGQVTVHHAAREGFVSMLEILLQMGADVNSVDELGNTALHEAAANGHLVMCKVLLDRGANICVKNNAKLPVLHCAVSRAHQSIKKRLTRSGERDDEGTVEEEHAKVCALLLDKGAAIDARDDNGNTLLHFASYHGCEGICHLLTARGLSVRLEDEAKVTSLHWAALKDHEPVCRLLIEKGAFVDARDSDKYTPLHWAAVAGRLRVGELLLRSGANVNAQECRSTTPLHKAVERSYTDFVLMLLQHEADVNVRDYRGKTALHLAVKADLREVCRTLIAGRANVNARDFKGKTPLYFAAKRNLEDICRMLLENGAEANLGTFSGFSALHIASKAGHGNICRLLVTMTADINAKEHIANRTPLHIAATLGKTEACVALLENSADLHLRDSEGYTVLHIVAEKGHEILLKILWLYLQVSATRSAHNTSNENMRRNETSAIDVRTYSGSSALHLAATKGHTGVCELLIRYGINVNARDNTNRRPIHYANENGHFSLRDILVQNGAIEYEA